MEFKIEHTEVYGLNKSIVASGNSYRTVMQDNTKPYTEKDLKRAIMLGRTKPGEGHDQNLTTVIVQFDLYAPLFMWKEIQRYKFLDFCSSQSTMHTLSKFKILECCVSETDPVILQRYEELLAEYNNSEDKPVEKWRTLIASLPCGFVLGATMSTNYRQLKTMYFQRRNHRLKERHEFCHWCESLPLFKELIIGDENV